MVANPTLGLQVQGGANTFQLPLRNDGFTIYGTENQRC